MMLKSLRRYASPEHEPLGLAEREKALLSPSASNVRPVIWQTSNIAQIRSLLLLREAELVVAKAQLTGNDSVDWCVRNRILDLDTKIADLRSWLAEPKGRGHT